jgi:hypothetical protein
MSRPTGPAPAINCARCGRRMGKRAVHFLRSDGAVWCSRCHTADYEGGAVFCTRAAAAIHLGLWPIRNSPPSLVAGRETAASRKRRLRADPTGP